MERPVVAFLLAFIAGSMDGYTFFDADTFATVQSGNIILSGFWLIQGNFGKAVFPILSVLIFGLGSMAAGIVMTMRRRHGKLYTTRILLIEAAVLSLMASSAFGGLEAHSVAFVVSFVAGIQGNAFHKSRGMLYGNVAVTFLVQMAFNFLAQSLFRRAGVNGEGNLVWASLFFLVLSVFPAEQESARYSSNTVAWRHCGCPYRSSLAWRLPA